MYSLEEQTSSAPATFELADCESVIADGLVAVRVLIVCLELDCSVLEYKREAHRCFPDRLFASVAVDFREVFGALDSHFQKRVLE